MIARRNRRQRSVSSWGQQLRSRQCEEVCLLRRPIGSRAGRAVAPQIHWVSQGESGPGRAWTEDLDYREVEGQ